MRGLSLEEICKIAKPARNMVGNVAIDARVMQGGEWPQLAASCSLDGKYPHTGEAIELAYARLRKADYLPGEVNAGHRRNRVKPLTSIPEPGIVTYDYNADAFVHAARNEIGIRILHATTRQRMYITDTGYMGLCHRSCTVGDQAYLLMGGDMPFVLRKLDNAIGSYQFKGESYVHGVMDGEGLLKFKPDSCSSRSAEAWLNQLGDGVDIPWPFETEELVFT